MYYVCSLYFLNFSSDPYPNPLYFETDPRIQNRVVKTKRTQNTIMSINPSQAVQRGAGKEEENLSRASLLVARW